MPYVRAVRERQYTKFILEEIDRISEKQNFKSHEYIRHATLESIPFSKKNQLLTPSGVKKRYLFKETYSHTITQLYDELESPETTSS
eukprot:CAMPEP_0115043518 /NCGR_PEP_ID=MMETSP0216-20121206/46916_1 /TAXON_ID=223996 /ORGANISM="Protocruzia adherens, Strain Boccale" /LENGTH=86 /DNA_ID=CAMNT_0002425853 /DNA_START=25 /DNA_END=285 /DNA_ORIENTATION=+